LTGSETAPKPLQVDMRRVMRTLRWNGYYDFPLRMSFRQITESVRRVAQAVTSVDDRHNLARLHKVYQENQISLIDFRDKESHPFAP
jgi:hypothetical protein